MYHDHAFEKYLLQCSGNILFHTSCHYSFLNGSSLNANFGTYRFKWLMTNSIQLKHNDYRFTRKVNSIFSNGGHNPLRDCQWCSWSLVAAGNIVSQPPCSPSRPPPLHLDQPSTSHSPWESQTKITSENNQTYNTEQNTTHSNTADGATDLVLGLFKYKSHSSWCDPCALFPFKTSRYPP